MAEFISKLQHNTYEKGEFSEEKVRTLEETIELIKTFPWDQERPLTSVELTGPSVTIRDEDVNWLKVGLYFNGKFCLYYLDCDNHLLEYHAPNLDDAINMVTAFFNQQLDLQKFEKHFFNIGYKQYFITKEFIYQIGWRQNLFMVTTTIFSLVTLYISYLTFKLKDVPLFARIEFPILFIVCTFHLIYLIYRYRGYKNII